MKSFYIVVSKTSLCRGNWGKSTSLKNALKSCKINKLSDNFVIYQAIVKNQATEFDLDNLCKCFNVNDMGGVEMYKHPSEYDMNMVNNLIVGWITNEDFNE
jgi:hypothetical protein